MLKSGAFLPIHWGTFNLAIHPWNEPPETLVRLGAPKGVPLIMPKLGQPVEPTRSIFVDPWWRAVSAAATEPVEPETVEGEAPVEFVPD